jgi:GT2 family glycosyltransferase
LPCEFNRVAACPADIIEPQVHVQGGFWSARLDVLCELGFSHRFPFEFCDVDLSRRLIAAGYERANVPTIVSVPDGTIPDPECYKYVHDFR